MATTVLPFKISVLLFVRNSRGEILLLLRNRAPNRGRWSPPGGKLEMDRGESPHECAIREAREEIGLELSASELHCFAIISEKGFEGSGHWMMFLFDCRRRLDILPAAIDEGRFAFYPPEAIAELPIPETDRQALWAIYHRHREGMVLLKADCRPGTPLEVMVEEDIGAAVLGCRKRVSD